MMLEQSINAIQGHIFRGRINGENAGLLACEIMYLAACLLTKADSFERVAEPEKYKDSNFHPQGHEANQLYPQH